ncbi:hypothetical protein [Escherichia coli]|uniref:hypothetical protein n=1 Tax=Escherichia coli TaxID=562 RepID=UPI0039A6F096
MRGFSFVRLQRQLGISRLTDAVSGDSLTAGEAPAALALSGDDDGPRQARSYQVMNGIAVLPVSGTLVSRTRALQPYSGMTGYNGIIARLQQLPAIRWWTAFCSIWTHRADGGGHLTALTSSPVCET